MADRDTRRGRPERGLGRGLEALLGEDPAEMAELDRLKLARMVPIEQLEPGPFQPRRSFAPEALAELTESIRARGVLQPILARRNPEHPETFQIIAGERRWRAAQAAALHEVPVVVKDLDDRAMLEVALVENVQRQDLNAIEEAEAYQRLIDEFGHKQDDLAKVIGKSRSHVANTLRLLNLPDAVRAMVHTGRLTAGHARALLTAEDPEGLAERIIAKGLTVRDAERLAAQGKAGRKASAGPAEPGDKDADTRALEREISGLLGLAVSIDADPAGQGGRVSIRYKSLEQLDDVLARLSKAHRPPLATDAAASMDADLAFVDQDDPFVPRED